MFMDKIDIIVMSGKIGYFFVFMILYVKIRIAVIVALNPVIEAMDNEIVDNIWCFSNNIAPIKSNVIVNDIGVKEMRLL